MSVADFSLLLTRLPLVPKRVDLHGFGEPLLDKRLSAKVRLARDKWPAVPLRIITTLGVPDAHLAIQDLCDAGLTEVEISHYGSSRSEYARIHGADNFDLAVEALRLVQRSDAVRQGVLKITVRSLEGAAVESTARQVGTTPTTTITRGRLHNYGNGRTFNTRPSQAVCSVVWGLRRRLLQITWDLRVIPCCFDYNASITLGDLRTQTLDEIFSGAAYEAFTGAHRTGQLDHYPVCLACETCQEK